MKHIAFIMDGNRRYGKKNNLSEYDAYISGGKRAFEICEFIAKNYEIEQISLFAFSKDNNKRDITDLKKMLLNNKELDDLSDYFKINFIGDIDSFDNEIKNKIEQIKQKNKWKYSVIINLFLNYSGKYDIEFTINNLLKQNIKEINYQQIISHSLVANIPDIDLLIRTGNRKRISNFALFLITYSEIYFCEKLWNEFSTQDLENIIKQYESEHFCLYGA